MAKKNPIINAPEGKAGFSKKEIAKATPTTLPPNKVQTIKIEKPKYELVGCCGYKRLKRVE